MVLARPNTLPRIAESAPASALEEMTRAEIDELGYLDVGSAGADLLLRLISARYEQRSTIITADVGIGGWGRVFGDDVAASAIADRVCRHCHLVKITGRSYRLKDLPRDGPVKP